MPGFARRLESTACALLCGLLVACGEPDAPGRFETSSVDARWSNGRLHVQWNQRLALSDEAREALVHGVPLTIALELTLRDSGSKTHVENQERRYEIRYMPLSDYYQLTPAEDGLVRTFPRLRHVLAELSRVDLDFQTGALPSGEYELLVRSSLDRQRMPPPMRLPAHISPSWRHDSDWSSWPVQVDPGA